VSVADRDWLAVHGELISLHVEKSSTYGDREDRLANFSAVAEATGEPPERYVLERMHEKTTRALNMIQSGQADRVREYPDLASLGIVCEAFRRRRQRDAGTLGESGRPLGSGELSARLEALAQLIEIVGLPEACEAFDVDRTAAERELIDALRLAAELIPAPEIEERAA
jgi:hypothetical protein